MTTEEQEAQADLSRKYDHSFCEKHFFFYMISSYPNGCPFCLVEAFNEENKEEIERHKNLKNNIPRPGQ